MPNSKDEARAEAYRKLRDEALSSERAAKTQAESAVAKAVVAEERMLKAVMDLDVVREKLAGAEVKATSFASEADGAKSDLLATTRRVIAGEVILKQLDARIESLRAVLEQIASWPRMHSSEAEAMRETAARGLSTDRMRQIATRTEPT